MCRHSYYAILSGGLIRTLQRPVSMGTMFRVHQGGIGISNSYLCTLTSFDHLTITVRSIPETVHFYSNVLGMTHSTISLSSTGNGNIVRHSLLFGQRKIDLQQVGEEYRPKSSAFVPGTADLCFLTDEDVAVLLDRFKQHGIKVVEGQQPVRNMGAKGPLRSVYIRDPDGNLLE